MKSQLQTKAIATMIASVYHQDGQSFLDLQSAIRDNVFVATMKLDGVTCHGSRNDPETYLKHYRAWFHHCMIGSFGNNLGRKKYLQPLSFAFVDFPDSRGSHSNQSVNELLNSGLLHVHAIIAIRPGAGQACRLPIVTAGSVFQRKEFGDVLVEPFGADRGSLKNVIDYIKKGADKISSRCKNDPYAVLPH